MPDGISEICMALIFNIIRFAAAVSRNAMKLSPQTFQRCEVREAEKLGLGVKRGNGTGSLAIMSHPVKEISRLLLPRKLHGNLKRHAVTDLSARWRRVAL